MPLIGTFTRRPAKMPLLDLDKITAGLSKTWSGFLRGWDRSLRSGNYRETTRYNYLLAAAQLGRYLGEYSPDPEADDAAEDPTAVSRAHVEAFQAWMIETRSAPTALNKHKALQQFFKWLILDEGEIGRSPMERVRQPKMPQKLVPVIPDEETTRVLGTCKGRQFAQLRDEAIIRLYCNTGAPVRGRQPPARRRRHGHRVGALPRQGQQGPARALRAEDRAGRQPLSAGPRQAQGG
jgi:integrase